MYSKEFYQQVIFKYTGYIWIQLRAYLIHLAISPTTSPLDSPEHGLFPADLPALQPDQLSLLCCLKEPFLSEWPSEVRTAATHRVNTLQFSFSNSRQQREFWFLVLSLTLNFFLASCSFFSRSFCSFFAASCRFFSSLSSFFFSWLFPASSFFSLF